ncbi:MAG TPA: DUF3467 domain-containing protein [Planctomycetota bacterium]|nr:DUF3467 domain-containing protein [Planctomycetota bacterium]HRR81130.1 DUF3467 domain-containing protein [Planctomycetota bacterium]HRT96107.1 DUF3467 domain-containing protein [Planctomycetota bacterium]
MPEAKPNTAGGETQQTPGGTTLHIRGQDVKTSYANMCLLLSTREEMILDFGLTLVGGAAEQREANMTVSNRIIMGVPAAKRLAIALSQAIQCYENAFGVIELEPRPVAPQKPAR